MSSTSMVQLSFSIRVSTTVKSVHLLGSWDKYQRQLPLATDKNDASSRSSWKATLRFHGNLVQPGRRYWYYYLIDGYHCSHNPSEPSTAEPTTGRVLNILDVPLPKGAKPKKAESKKAESKTSKTSRKSYSSSASTTSSSSSSSSSSSERSKVRDRDSKSSKSHSSSSSSSSATPRDSHRHSTSRRDKDNTLPPWSSLSLEIPKGRPLSASQIKAPKPVSPHATRLILDEAFGPDAGLDDLSMQLGAVNVYDDDLELDVAGQPALYEDDSFDDDSYDEEDDFTASNASNARSDRSDSTCSSASQRSSESGYSTPEQRSSPCVCERFGITRDGRRVRLDCRGLRCGAYAKRSTSPSSDSDDGTDNASSASSSELDEAASISGEDISSSCSSAESDDDDDDDLSLAAMAAAAAAAKGVASRKLAATAAVTAATVGGKLGPDMSAAAAAVAAVASDAAVSPLAARRHAIYLR